MSRTLELRGRGARSAATRLAVSMRMLSWQSACACSGGKASQTDQLGQNKNGPMRVYLSECSRSPSPASPVGCITSSGTLWLQPIPSSGKSKQSSSRLTDISKFTPPGGRATRFLERSAPRQCCGSLQPTVGAGSRVLLMKFLLNGLFPRTFTPLPANRLERGSSVHQEQTQRPR